MINTDMFPYAGSVFVRTVTFHYTGKVVEIRAGFLILEHAAWIAESGRWATVLKTGELEEIEPFPNEVAISLSAIVDVCPWNHPLPRDQK